MRSFHKYFNIGKLHCAPPPYKRQMATACQSQMATGNFRDPKQHPAQCAQAGKKLKMPTSLYPYAIYLI